MTRTVGMKAYSLRKPADKPAADLPEERKCTEVLGPNKLQKELLALRNTNRLLEEQLQSTGGLAIVELTQRLEARDRDLAEAVQSLEESRLQLQRKQRELDAIAEDAAKLRLELVDQKKTNDEFASAAIAISRTDVDLLREEVVALRADNQVLEEQALAASADSASASLKEAQVRQKLAASIGEAATNKAAVAKTLELLAAKDAELAEARHQLFSSQRSTHSLKEFRRQTNQHTVVVHQSSELAAKDAIIAKLELTLAKQEALLAAAKVNSTSATSEAEVTTMTPPKQLTKPKCALVVEAPRAVSTSRSKAMETEPTSTADCIGVSLDAASAKTTAANASESSTVRSPAAGLGASCAAKIPSSALDADWSIFD